MSIVCDRCGLRSRDCTTGQGASDSWLCSQVAVLTRLSNAQKKKQKSDHSALLEKKNAEIALLKQERNTANGARRKLECELAATRRDMQKCVDLAMSEDARVCAEMREEIATLHDVIDGLRVRLVETKANGKPDGEAWVVEHEEKLLWAGTSWSHVVPVLMDRREAAMMSRSLNGTKARKIQWRFADDQ